MEDEGQARHGPLLRLGGRAPNYISQRAARALPFISLVAPLPPGAKQRFGVLLLRSMEWRRKAVPPRAGTAPARRALNYISQRATRGSLRLCPFPLDSFRTGVRVLTPVTVSPSKIFLTR